ncbi:F-box only protein 36 isoform X2 [Apteryx mantelli]|uniref:F-box only protein 36 isoform X2 n=1 Tax=Apteryx mantelli TaxID=2696672 RepID=A0ABM4EZ67_9AVES
MATARQRPNMASLLREELLEARGQAPAPSKDFCQLLVTRRQVIFRWWKISLRSEFRDARPGEIKESHEDFLDDSSLHSNYDFLERLPVPLLLYIISFLELEDIARLSQVSHRFKMICNSNTLWESIVENLCDTITPEMRELAQEMGWKQFFFTNRLRLQLQLRRRRQKHAEKEKLTE